MSEFGRFVHVAPSPFALPPGEHGNLILAGVVRLFTRRGKKSKNLRGSLMMP